MDSPIVNLLGSLNPQIESSLRGNASLMAVSHEVHNIMLAHPGADYSSWKFARAWDLSRNSISILTFHELCVEAVRDCQVAEWCDTSCPIPSGNRAPSRPCAAPPGAWLFLQAKWYLDRDVQLSKKQRKNLLEMAESDTVSANDICTIYQSRTGATRKETALPVIIESDEEEAPLTTDRDLDQDLDQDFDPVNTSGSE